MENPHKIKWVCRETESDYLGKECVGPTTVQGGTIFFQCEKCVEKQIAGLKPWEQSCKIKKKRKKAF